ncbi:MAG TPA: pantoate--beta-alanine ligase [Terriglobales bacterium]|nr:pantoate--beta-alanine ligase [Terriglobales bacterium]
MKVIATVQDFRAARCALSRGTRVGLVPTMGALHEGHLSLVRAAKAQSDVVVVSIFVNPTQFGPNEDFAKYPRNLERDCAMLDHEKVDFVFAPSVEEMYPKGAVTFVAVEGLSDKLCGRSRRGHFRGVTTIVSKLFHVVEPDLAFFGQKDAAQVAIIKRMVKDLAMPVAVVVCPIMREADGLAMSSRNSYLDPEQRRSALVLSRSLSRVRQAFDKGQRDSAELIAAGKELFPDDAGARLDYLEIVDPDSLETLSAVNQPALVAIAAFVGSTRLIDNLVLYP